MRFLLLAAAILTLRPVMAGTRVFLWERETNAMPAGLHLTNLISIATGEEGSVGLRDDGLVVLIERHGWADFFEPPVITNAVPVAARYYSGAALRADGRIARWGQQRDVVGSNIVAIAVGAWQTVGLRNDGYVQAWSQTGFPGGTNVPPAARDVVAISRKVGRGSIALALNPSA